MNTEESTEISRVLAGFIKGECVVHGVDGEKTSWGVNLAQRTLSFASLSLLPGRHPRSFSSTPAVTRTIHLLDCQQSLKLIGSDCSDLTF